MSVFPRALLAAILLFAATAHAQSTSAVAAKLDAHAPGALAAAEVLAKADAKNADAWILLARARVQAGQGEAAIKAAQRATLLAPRNALAFRWLGTAYSVRIGQVGMFGMMAIAPKLRDAFEQAVRLDGDLLDARFALIEFYLQAPGAMGGGVDKARVQAREIGKRDAAQGALAQGRIALQEKQPDAAYAAYQSALAAKPADPRVRAAVAMGYQQLERWPDAFALLQAWNRETPATAAARYQLGRAAALSGQHGDEGLAALQAFLGLPRGPDDPENKHAYWRMAQIHAKAGRKAEARTALATALKLDPQFAEARAEMAKL